MIGELVAECGGFNGFTRRIFAKCSPCGAREGRALCEGAGCVYECSSDPVRDIEAFVRLLVVNAVLGNCDGHLKNLTVLRGVDWSSFALAPVYDIVSTVVYGGLDRHMAMHIGSTNKIDEVGRDDFLALAKELDVSPRMVRRLIEEVAARRRT
ncbi:MAG: HipA domain-containing protein [Adlercreutzia equolifaciens]